MDFLEKIFSKLSGWARRAEATRRSAFGVDFEAEVLSLSGFAQGAIRDPHLRVQLKSYDGYGAIFDDTILLPSALVVFEDRALNRRLFLHKALSGGVLRSLSVRSQAATSSWIQRALQVAILRDCVKEEAAPLFPEYLEWHHELVTDFTEALSREPLPEVDQAWLRIEARLRSEIESASALSTKERKVSADTLRRLEKLVPPELYREITAMPRVALAMGCEPIMEKTLLSDASSDETAQRARSEEPDSEREGKTAAEIEVIDLEKERKRENPVTHSFEKLETADEYKGGYKTADGSDQLAEHQNALDELEMKQVTRGGESASSTYRADISELVHTRASGKSRAKKGAFKLYPEWDYRKRDLLLDHCRLYLENPAPPADGTGAEWLAQTTEKYSKGLEEWKHRLSMLVNERRWRDRQWEGTEISIDAFVRYLGDARHTGSGDSRLYQKNFPGVRDFSCLVLVDQSYSTDSWVMNRRVLDVELESLALVSELLGPLREPVAVAGTWSETRNHCHFRLYKDFDSPWSDLIAHAPSIVPQGYTRLGPAIRHATEKLANQGGRHRLLILLTDGKPTDYDRYEGRYGIEDIHHACLEAAQRGITVRALAVEKEAKNYFPHLFGARDYQILQNPDELPERLFRIYLESIRR